MIDPYKYREKVKNNLSDWLNAIPEESRAIVTEYIRQVQQGVNVSRGRGVSRGDHHIASLMSRLRKICELITQETGKKDITSVTAKEMQTLFFKMNKGEITHGKGKEAQPYKAVRDYVKIFKAFWHWYQRYQRNDNNKEVGDITLDLASDKKGEPEFVHITLDDLNALLDNAKMYYRVLMLFLFDTGMRAPTELMNIKKQDVLIYDKNGQEYIQINIRNETSKTFGRKITLTLSSKLFKQYLEQNDFKASDFLFQTTPHITNQYLKRLYATTFKTKKAKGYKPEHKSLTMYDFRHSSTCYWMKRQKSNSWLKYRFGWIKDDMIVYYSKFLGMEDDVKEDDLLQGVERHQLEKNIEGQNKELNTLKEELQLKDTAVSELQGRLTELEKKLSFLLSLMDKPGEDEGTDWIHGELDTL